VNISELKDRLVAADVPGSNYFIVGIDSQEMPGKGGGFGELVISRTDDGHAWRLFTEERGRIQRETVYATEDEACEAAWEELKPRDRPVHVRTAEERARSRARAQQMIAEYSELDREYRDGGAER
jgi:hypothetical protein